jgi:cystathionine beta-synthase
MKDRVAMHIVADAERRGLLRPGGTIVEADQRQHRHGARDGGGRARLQLRLRHARQDVAGEDRIAQGVRRQGRHLPDGGRARGPALLLLGLPPHRRGDAGAFYANQYHNPANPEAHYLSDAPEIWEQTGGEIDVFCAGMGTGGTISGLRPILQGAQAGFKIVGVDPIGSLYYEYVKTGA